MARFFFGAPREMTMTKIDVKTDSGAPFAFEGLDRVMHEKARLGLLEFTGRSSQGARLLRSESALRPDRRQSQPPSPGAAGSGLGRNPENPSKAAGPRPICRLTRSGRRRFLDYLALLEQLVRDAAKIAGEDFSDARLRILPG